MKKVLLLLLISFLGTVLINCGQPDQPTIGLYVAIKRGDIDQVERHIFWKTDINSLNIDGQTPLHESAINGRIIISQLLLKNGADINKQNKNDQTALDIALLNGRTQLADVLIDKFSAEFDATLSLFDIVNQNVHDRDVIRFLVRRGAQINSHDDNGNTPLIIAVNNGQRLVAKHLIDNNADVNVIGKNGITPLAAAK
ncbi:MAG: ankyrin repeat domain-containing protein, partial [Gammaproteobacteria bacterium]|nr:ankyrin repeat domain-containing protein [Gammaproteobacteria bacterium]